MVAVKWLTCGDDNHWCSLENLNLDSIKAGSGVYIIWHEGNPGRVARVGSGIIRQRLGAHRNDAEITAYRKFGALRVTWAAVSEAQREGIEAYLGDTLNPLVGDAFPDVPQIAVNTPW